jgi:hypothetical protein
MPPDADVPGSKSKEATWRSERRRQVVDYLDGANLAYGSVGESPAWFLFPYVSIWAVESVKNPGWVGWWIICGDCPTDYVTCRGDRTPRAAMRDFASRWRAAVPYLSRGEQHPDFVVGRPGEAKNLAPLLAERAQALEAFAADEDIWRQSASN